jgi:hypothetical protein
VTTNTATAIIQAAFEDAELCAVGQTVSSAQATRGLARLNDVIAFEATQGLKPWLQEIVTVALVEDQAAYRIGSGGASGNTTRPLQVTQGIFLSSTGARTPLTGPLSREEYTRIQTADTSAAVHSFYPDRKATYTDVYFWNTPDATAAAGTVELIVRREISHISVVSATTVFPAEWAMFLRWALADELSTGQPESVQVRCGNRASVYREALQGFDVEDASTKFQPNMQGYTEGGFR